jgi:hypothetical protein
MGAAAGKRANQFAWPIIAGQYRDLYQRVLANNALTEVLAN